LIILNILVALSHKIFQMTMKFSAKYATWCTYLTGVRWSSWRTSRAATFCTRCRGARVDAASTNSTELQ